MKKVLLVVATRPNFIKAAALYKKLSTEFEVKILHTGQHYSFELSDKVIQDLNIPIYKNLNCNTYIREDIRDAIIAELKLENPDLVVTFGDVNSTVAAVWAAKSLGIPVAHVEAGLRTDMAMEEEFNRRISDYLCDICFTTEPSCTQNLIKEFNTTNKVISQSGNCAIDTLKLLQTSIIQKIADPIDVIVTCHRKENLNEKRVTKLMSLIGTLNKKYKVCIFGHPKLRKYLDDLNIPTTVEIRESPGYIEFLKQLYNAKLLVTDSAGAVCESFIFKVPCLIFRGTFEHKICLSSRDVLFSQDYDACKEHINTSLVKEKVYVDRIDPNHGWSDGKACDRILVILKLYFGMLK